jgi:hypothetical protein
MNTSDSCHSARHEPLGVNNIDLTALRWFILMATGFPA